MGAELHITRRAFWADQSAEISAGEWLGIIENDSELVLQPANGPYFTVWTESRGSQLQWLDWSDGQILSKNPTADLRMKMFEIAQQLGATLQGDDGELYDSLGNVQEPRTVPLLVQLRNWWSRRGSRSAKPLQPIAAESLPFQVGDMVQDLWGNRHTVNSVEPAAEHGLGVIRTTRDDGTKHVHAMIAHGLSKVD
jgi:hypothetical protein